MLHASSNNFTALLYPLYPLKVTFELVGAALINLTAPVVSSTSSTLQLKVSLAIAEFVVLSLAPE